MIAPAIVELRQPITDPVGSDAREIRAARVDSESRFTELRSAWDSLVESSEAASPFLTWEWLHSWWRHLSGTSRLRVLTAGAENHLIAVAPFRVTTGVARMPCLDLLGTGEAGSDYLDVITRSGFEADGLDAIERFVVAQNMALRLTHLSSSAAAIELSNRLDRRRWSQVTTPGGICPYIPLAGHTWDSYLATLGASHRANVRRRLRALEQKFDVRFEQVTADQDRREALTQLTHYHERRFEARGTAFRTASLCAFHEEATRRFLDRGWLRMFVLRVNGAPAAVMYGFLYNRHVLLLPARVRRFISATQYRSGADGTVDSHRHRARRCRVRHALGHRTVQIPLGSPRSRASQPLSLSAASSAGSFIEVCFTPAGG
jgi:CelD/BcsL family acetyltransferase involved in cellulose biosynthesis